MRRRRTRTANSPPPTGRGRPWCSGGSRRSRRDSFPNRRRPSRSRRGRHTRRRRPRRSPRPAGRRLVRRSPTPNCERCSDTVGRAAASWTSAPRPQELRRVRKNLLPSDDGPVTLTVATTGPVAPGIGSAHSCGLPGDRDDDAGIRFAGGSTTDPDGRDHHRPRYRHRNVPQRAVCSPRCASRSQPTGRTRRTRSPHSAREVLRNHRRGARHRARWPGKVADPVPLVPGDLNPAPMPTAAERSR